MDAELIWGLWLSLESYINKKDVETAIDAMLDYLLEYDFDDFGSLIDYAESAEETEFAKIVQKFIKRNGLDEEEY
jgi:hypothetical protein